MTEASFAPPAGFIDPRAAAGMGADTPVMTALSGGADSVALLCMLKGAGPLSAVHVHHGIRGAEADRDEAFCRALCDRLGVPLTVLRVDVPARARELGVGLETAAREARYAAIAAHMRTAGVPLLATAHHANDQLETLLQNLLRGSGLRGLCGIPVCRPLGDGLFVVRPLLGIPRAALLGYLQKAGQTYVTDSTNSDLFCPRNRLRAAVIPTLCEIQPAAAEHAAATAALLAEDEAFLTGQAADFLKKQGNEPSLHALSALPRPIFARVMRALFPFVPERVHIAALYDFCRGAKPHATLSLPGVRLAAEGGRLVTAPALVAAAPYEIFPVFGENPLPDGVGMAIFSPYGENCELHGKNIYKYSTCIAFSSAIINGRVSIRTRRAGDTVLSGGMHKTLRKLNGMKPLPLDLRARLPLLADEAGVLAVPLVGRAGAPLLRDGAGANPDLTISLFFN